MPANGEQTSSVFLHLAPIAHTYEGAMMAFLMASIRIDIYNDNIIKVLCLPFESSSGTTGFILSRRFRGPIGRRQACRHGRPATRMTSRVRNRGLMGLGNGAAKER